MPAPRFTRSDVQRLAHRTHVAETFVVGEVRDGSADDDADGVPPLAVEVPLTHPYFGSRNGTPARDDLFLQEVLRQASSVFAHVQLGVPLDTAMLVRRWDYTVGNASVDQTTSAVSATVLHQRAGRGGHVASATLEAVATSASGAEVARLTCDAVYLPGNRYAALREARASVDSVTGQPLTTAGRAWPSHTRAECGVVGVVRDEDVVLADLDLAAGFALLTPSTAHRSYFDHALDHIPTMVIHEGAVQLAVATGVLAVGERHDVVAEYHAFVELGEPAQLVVVDHNGAPGVGGTADVTVEVRQGDQVCATVHLRSAEGRAERAVAPVAIWTDFAGVLTEDTDVTVDRYCRRVGITADEFIGAMSAVGRKFSSSAMEVLDRPVVDHPTWAAAMRDEVEEATGRSLSFEDFPREWFAEREANPDWADALRRWRSDGMFVGLASNMVPAWDVHRRKVAPDSDFDALMLSCEVGVRKPEAGLFELGARLSGLPAERNILVDDLPANCAGATAAGWSAVHFVDALSAIRAIDDLIGRSA